MSRPHFSLLLALALGGIILGGTVQAEPLQNALTRLGDAPALQAAQAQVQAAEARLRAAGEIYDVQVNAGYASRRFEEPLPAQSGLYLGAQVSLKPIQFGDNADVLEVARIEAQGALLTLRETFTLLGIGAYDLTYRLALARQAQVLLLSLEETARASLVAVRPSPPQAAQTRSAEALYRDLQEQTRSAAENIRLLEAELRALLGTSDVQAGVPVRLQPKTSPDSVRAGLLVNLAAIQLRAAQRNLQPVGRLDLTRSLGGQGTVGIAVDTRNLAPRLSLGYATAPLDTLPVTPGTVNAAPLNTASIRSTFNLGVSFEVSPAARSSLAAAQASVVAAQRGLDAQQRADALKVSALNTALDQAGRAVTLRQQASADARQSLQEACEGEALGQGSALEILQAVAAVAQAEDQLRRSQLDHMGALLNLYRFANQPVTELSAPSPG